MQHYTSHSTRLQATAAKSLVIPQAGEGANESLREFHVKAYDRLLDDISNTLIPNLEHFPAMGRSFLGRPVCSVEAANALARLQPKLHDGALREYLFGDYLVLYAQFDDVIHLLSIKHHRELSFDFQSLWYGN